MKVLLKEHKRLVFSIYENDLGGLYTYSPKATTPV